MTEPHSSTNGSCSCGKASFTVSGAPLLRAYCHCLICQSFNEADYADIVAFRSTDVALNDEASTEFKVYKQPPLVRRGTCKDCGKPSIEKLAIPGLPRVTIVPTRNLPSDSLSIEPVLHIFYHRRTADVQDDLPKHSGFLNSQTRFTIALLKALWT